MADEVTCPICKTEAQRLDKISEAYGFDCTTTHGRFRVVETVFACSARCAAGEVGSRTEEGERPAAE
jgi:hypothetical protein